MNLLNTEDKPVILSLHGICYGIIICCFLTENHNTIITLNHIKNFHNITNPLSLSAILSEDHILYEKIKKSKSKRKGRIYTVIPRLRKTRRMTRAP